MSHRGARACALAFLLAAACSRGSPALEEANRLLRDGQAEEALAAYRRAQADTPGMADLHYGEGLALYALERYVEAEEPLRRAIELAPEEGRYRLYLGHVLSRLGHAGEAVEEYRRATELEPIEPEGWRALGLALYNQGRYPQARRALERYLAFARTAPDHQAIRELVRSLPEE